MNKKLLYPFLFALSLFVSCGKDNDDIVRPEDVSNVELDIEGINFGVIDVTLNATSTVYKYTNSGIFLADNATSPPPTNYTFHNCPLSQEIKILSDGIQNLAAGIRDVNDLSEGCLTCSGTYNNLLEYHAAESDNINANEYFFIQYTTSTSENLRTLVFSRAQLSFNPQVNTYFDFVIRTISLLNQRDELPPLTTNCRI